MVFLQKYKKFFINNILFLNWNYFNLISVILKRILDCKTVMFAFLNFISLIKIFLLFFSFYYSRSKNIFWFKGLNSKNFQLIKFFYIDCDMDIVLLKILQIYNLSCHTNNILCFLNKQNFYFK